MDCPQKSGRCIKGGRCGEVRGTQREYSSKPSENGFVERILVFKR